MDADKSYFTNTNDGLRLVKEGKIPCRDPGTSLFSYAALLCLMNQLPIFYLDIGDFGAVLEGPAAEYLEARNCDLRIMPERISSLEKLTGENAKEQDCVHGGTVAGFLAGAGTEQPANQSFGPWNPH